MIKLALFIVLAMPVFYAPSASAIEDHDVLIVSTVEPIYPMAAIGGCMEGEVVLEFTVTIEGTVEDVTVIRSDHDGVFDEAAVEAVRQWRFKPRILEGEPVARRTRVPMRFEKADGCEE